MMCAGCSNSWLAACVISDTQSRKNKTAHQMTGLYLTVSMHTSRKMSLTVKRYFLSGNNNGFSKLAVTCGSPIIPQSMN